MLNEQRSDMSGAVHISQEEKGRRGNNASNEPLRGELRDSPNDRRVSVVSFED